MKPYIEILPKVGKYFFAIGIMAIGIEHIIFNDFIIGRAPSWPDNLSGQSIWAYVSGFYFFVVGLMILSKIHVRKVSLLGAAIIFIWAFIRHLPIVLTDTLLAPSWTSAGKAMLFIGGLFVIAATSPSFKDQSRLINIPFINSYSGLVTTSRICLAIFLLITGLQHFIFVKFVASLIPVWFPGDPIFWTYFAGVALICGGLGILISKTTSLAAFLSGTMIFSWFWIVHLPRAVASMSDNIAIFEALAFSGIAFILMKPDILKQE